ncbi:MAG TPA: PQQ-dependent dehydrogenase, methanol/ethanol family [Terriglobia bacterium]|nr:PQQ-dependent dehydrogenase, methanol/ethanol family [Terriglobia bacterium]
MKRQQPTLKAVFLCMCALLFAGSDLGQAQDGANNTVPGQLQSVHLVSPVPDGDWQLPAGDYANTRYDPLDQINTGNVKNLQVVDIVADGITRGHEGQPLVVNNTLYMVTPFPNNLLAFDLTKPNFPMRWKYEPHPNPVAKGVACCDWVNRGASYGDGKIVYATLDNNVVAVDANTGKQVWRTEVGDIHRGETTTMAAFIVKNVVMVGNSGGELGVRGKVTGLSLSDGHVMWTAYNTGPDNDCLIGPDFHPFYKKDQGQNLGVKTWPADAWKHGGGPVWGWISYDPELNLVFYGTGNPGPWNPDQRPGDNKWTCTVWARDPETGQAKWATQLVPHDAWDYDEIMENIPIDMNWDGKMRKLLLHPARNGFMLVMDRTTGELLSAEAFEPVNWASGYDLKTGLPQVDPAKRTHTGIYARQVCPSSTGGKEFVPSAFSPRTGMLYIPAHNTCMDHEAIQANYIVGTPYLGSSTTMFAGPGGYQGELIGWDVQHAKKVWSIKDDILPVYSGVLATGGDLVFYGTLEGWFRAVDAHTGKVLWQFKTGSGIVGDPITFRSPDGKQYVAIYSGVGGWMGAVAQPSISLDDPYAALGVTGAMGPIKTLTAPGDDLYIFALK